MELKDIQLPDMMKRAMAKQAEAEREKRAKIIAAEGESLAAAALGDASDTMMQHPLALQLGERYAILAPLDSGAKRAMPRLRAQGFADRLASVRGVGVSVVDLARGANDAWERIVATGRRCIDEDGADVLVMGCMSMAFMGVERELSGRLGAPVVSPVLAALKTAETLIACGLAHARTAWPSRSRLAAAKSQFRILPSRLSRYLGRAFW